MAKGIQCRRVISGGKTSKRLCFIESLLFFCCFLPSDIHLGFAGRIGTSLARSGFFSPCFFCSPRYWRGSLAAFRQRLLHACAAPRGRSPLALQRSQL